MKCQAVCKRLEAYLDGTLSPRTQRQLERHLANCPSCRAERARAQEIATALQAVERVSPPPDFVPQVLAKLPPEVPAGQKRGKPAQPLLRPLALGAVLGGLLLFLVARYVASPPTVDALSLAQWYLAQEQFEEAVAAYRKALGQHSPSPSAHFGLAYALWRCGNSEEAKREYERGLYRATEETPGLALAYESLGKIHQEEGQWEEAVRCYQAALQLDSRLVDAHLNLGLIYEHWGWEEEAQQEYEAALEVEPSHLLAQENLGRLYERQGEWAKAAAVYQQGAEATASPVAYWQLGRLYERLGSLEEAAIAYQMAALGPPETDT